MKRSFSRLCMYATVVVATGMVANHALAGTINFESETLGSKGNSHTITADDGIDVTFAAPGTGINVRTLPAAFPNPNQVLSTLPSDTQPMTITFETGFSTDFVQITNHINGTHTTEVDVIVGTAFDIFNNIVDTQTNSNTLHILQGLGIVRVEYVSLPSSSGYVIDNFTFNNSQAVPVPAAAWLGLSLLGGMGLVRKLRA